MEIGDELDRCWLRAGCAPLTRRCWPPVGVNLAGSSDDDICCSFCCCCSDAAGGSGGGEATGRASFSCCGPGDSPMLSNSSIGEGEREFSDDRSELLPDEARLCGDNESLFRPSRLAAWISSKSRPKCCCCCCCFCCAAAVAGGCCCSAVGVDSSREKSSGVVVDELA